MQKILIIEDDTWISLSLKLYLENSGFEIFLHEEWLGAINKIKEINPDLLILDINLPGKSWIEIAKDIRKEWNLPIIILTARSSEIDKITWLEIWADDYIAKPFSPRELLARINTILRRSQIDDNNLVKDFIVFKNIKIDINNKIVTLDNKVITLTANEYSIMKKIFEENWKLVKRETLMIDVIWYDKYLYDRTIDTHIKNIRKKLRPEGSTLGVWEKDIIITVRWEWYRLNK